MLKTLSFATTLSLINAIKLKESCNSCGCNNTKDHDNTDQQEEILELQTAVVELKKALDEAEAEAEADAALCGTTAYAYFDLECKGDIAETILAPTDEHWNTGYKDGIRHIGVQGRPADTGGVMQTNNQISSIMVPRGFGAKLWTLSATARENKWSVEIEGSCKCISLDNENNLSHHNFDKDVSAIWYTQVLL